MKDKYDYMQQFGVRDQGRHRQDPGRLRRLHRGPAALRLLRDPAELPALQQDESRGQRTRRPFEGVGFFLSGNSLPFRQAAADIDFRNGGVIDQIEAFASGRSVADDPVTDLGGAVTDRFQRFFKLRRQSSF